MFHRIAERSFPALLITLGFVLVAYGAWAWAEADRQYEFQTRRMIEERVNIDLANQYGSFAYRRIRDEEMSSAELQKLKNEARKQLFAEHGDEIKAVHRSEKNAALLRLALGTAMMCFAFWRYALAFRRKQAEKRADKDNLSA